ncbi:hypothetical protein V9T40_010491 [Parthenolecanium corni]|uniref:Uncharacterized protein n=1 Tax=Parthenolecanium corni TaxID=536013 RepID=A0AAN9T4A1_9HEMI
MDTTADRCGRCFDDNAIGSTMRKDDDGGGGGGVIRVADSGLLEYETRNRRPTSALVTNYDYPTVYSLLSTLYSLLVFASRLRPRAAPHNENDENERVTGSQGGEAEREKKHRLSFDPIQLTKEEQRSRPSNLCIRESPSGYPPLSTVSAVAAAAAAAAAASEAK